ncbi:hypothetical protein AMJ49_05845 [Parcubacteria bacterium DG_74_2]|nr:MAG: hypothetical protein AMJ49_05845 [Parcubacteria bacterium DG_74_2]
MSNIVFQYLQWHFNDQVKAILIAWKNFLSFGLNYFSIPLLLRTFCSPWRRYRYFYPKSFDFKKYIDTFTFNAISRGIGMVMRTILIIIGIIAEFFIFVAGLLFVLFWLFLPVILVILFFYGIKFLF